MLTYRKDPARIAILWVLLAANVLMYLSWPWLRSMRLGSDSSDIAFFRLHKSGEVSLNAWSLLRNDVYLASFFDLIRGSRKVLYMGTSESVEPYNLAAQLNQMSSDKSRIVALAQAGMSPIHSCVTIAKCKRERIKIPPVILVINLVYFTQSHDVINDGWLGRVIRSHVFLQMNHRDIRSYLSDEVLGVYDEHFALRRMLYPVTIQQYLGNLLYLSFHQSSDRIVRVEHLLAPTYEFDGVLPDYDEDRYVHAGYRASDQKAKDRWQVKTVEECLNLKGLSSAMAILQKQSVPVLLLVLPMNQTFYKYNGLDMEEYNRRYSAIRREIGTMLTSENTDLIDLYDMPELHLGFKDRMHADQYGNFQLSKYILESDEYTLFIEAVERYYAGPRVNTD